MVFYRCFINDLKYHNTLYYRLLLLYGEKCETKREDFVYYGILYLPTK